MPIPDEYLIKERFDMPGGGSVEVHDSRYLSMITQLNAQLDRENSDFHNLLMSKGVKAYRCNDGWVDREKKIVTFGTGEKEKGYYWADKSLDVGDLIFIGNTHMGGRFARVTKVEKLFDYCLEDQYCWSRQYHYEPLDETLDGVDRTFITEKTLTRKQKILKFLGLFDENKIKTDIFE